MSGERRIGRPPSEFWTDTRVETLRRMMKEGASFAQIGSVIGCSRNAAIGKARRIGFAAGVSRRTGRPRLPESERKARSSSVRMVRPKPNAQRQRAVEAVLQAEPVRTKAPDFADNPVTLLQLEPQHCRWPLGDPQEPDFRFCGGARVNGLPYCQRHARRALP